jgi:polysaccharide export outer membrane protein
MSVFDLPELNIETPVRPDGKITISILNDVEVAGLTVSDAQKKLTRLLSPYVVNPKVSLSIKDYQAQKVSVIGAVAKPGSYELLENNITVTEILSEAGGRTSEAGSRLIIIPSTKANMAVNANAAFQPESAKRARLASDSSHTQGIEFYMDDLTGQSGTAPLNILLRHGDTVVVPEAGEVQVLGDVKAPGSYKITGKMSILGAIAAAGGLEYSANANKVELVRDLSQEQKAIALIDLEKVALEKSANFRLQDGDVVQVPSSSGRFAGRQVVEFINGLFNVGVQTAQ